jgi:spermidine synthase
VALSGASLPLIFDHLRREFGELGDTAGKLYSWNTVGSLLGALLGGYALLFWLDLDAVVRVAIAGLAVSAAAITIPVLGMRRVVAFALLVPLLAAVAALPSWDPRHLTAGLFRNRTHAPTAYQGPQALIEKVFSERPIIFHRDDPIATVTVRERLEASGRANRSIHTNGKSDGLIPDDYLTMAFVSLLTALFAEKPERSFVIGYGTGVSVGELAALDSAREVVVAEISPAVIEAAPLFDYGNLAASRSPKVEFIRSDAYRALLRSPGSFDLIVSEPSNPWVAGVEMLYSREFLEAARDKLAPGGVFGQWIHLYETDVQTLAIVFRTYASVFEHVSAWYALGTDLILMGFRDARNPLDLERLARRARRPDFAAGLARSGIHDLESLLAHEILPLGVIHAARLPGPVHTLLHPRLGYAAARAFFAGLAPLLPTTAHLEPARVGFENSLLRRHIDGLEGGLTDPVRARILRETCRYRLTECYTLLARWRHSVPHSRSRERLIAELRREGILPAEWDPALVETLAALYDETPPPRDSGVPVQLAVDTAKYFAVYFHHAAPFSRRPLFAAWAGCVDGDGEEPAGCDEMRRQVELLLGPLDAE